MLSRIPDIYSDSTIASVEMFPRVLRMIIQLFTEERISLQFNGYWASKFAVGWNDDEAVEALVVKDNSELLEETARLLLIQEESVEGLRSYQVVTPYGDVVIEVIARSVQVDGRFTEDKGLS